MKKVRLIVVLAVFFGLVGFLAAPQASAQVLDGKWFRLNCTIKAMQVNEATGIITPFNLNFQAYMYYEFYGYAPDGSSIYFGYLFVRTSPGHWELSYVSLHGTLTYSELIFPDTYLTFLGEGLTYINTFTTPFVNNQLTTLFAQGEIFGGLNSVGNRIYGGITIQGGAVSAPPFAIPVIN